MGSFLTHLLVYQKMSCSSDHCCWGTSPSESTGDLGTPQLKGDGPVFSRAGTCDTRQAKAYLGSDSKREYLSKVQTTSTSEA